MCVCVWVLLFPMENQSISKTVPEKSNIRTFSVVTYVAEHVVM